MKIAYGKPVWVSTKSEQTIRRQLMTHHNILFQKNDKQRYLIFTLVILFCGHESHDPCLSLWWSCIACGHAQNENPNVVSKAGDNFTGPLRI